MSVPSSDDSGYSGVVSVLMIEGHKNLAKMPAHLNDNNILNDVGYLKHRYPDRKVVLVTKDIDVRLKARCCGIQSQDYHSDQLLSGIE